MTAATLLEQIEAEGIRLPRGYDRDGEHYCKCPKCEPSARSSSPLALAVRIEGDRAVWYCHRCNWKGAASTARSYTGRAPVKLPPLPKTSTSEDVRELARQLWIESVPLAGTLGAAYLEARACDLPPAEGDVRFHPRVFCPKVSRNLPTIVCRVSTVATNVGVGVHRIFLDPLGSDKAIAKMRLGGADEPVCIRLFPDDHVTSSLAIAEGVETALAAAKLHSPIWSTIDANGMAAFPVVNGIETLIVYADHDPAGIRAGIACVDRWRAAGRAAIGIAPERQGLDLNDVVREAIE